MTLLWIEGEEKNVEVGNNLEMLVKFKRIVLSINFLSFVVELFV